jgi:N-acyl-D-amino-acid deacylase
LDFRKTSDVIMNITRRQFLQAGIGLASTTIYNVGCLRGALVQPQERPVIATGQEDPRLAAYDELMTNFMRRHRPPGAALAVTKEGRLVYARGFGYADVEKKAPVHPGSLFRIASISKPFTSAAVFRLVEHGKLKLNAKVFGLLKARPYLKPGARLDPRIHEITIRQCLQHTGGWNRDKSPDPMGAAQAHEIAKALGKRLPIQAQDIIRYTLGQPLDFNPGLECVYSNFGYCVLGRVIEAASGESYQQYVSREILQPLGIRHMRQGKNLLRGRAPNEVRYYDSKYRTGPAISGPHIGQPAPLPYGVECLETMDANGGWIASAVDLVRFAVALEDPKSSKLLREGSITEMLARPPGRPGWEPNGRRKEAYYGCGWDVRPVDVRHGKYTKWHGGGLAGTSTLLVCRSDRINWAVLFNSDSDAAGKAFADTIDPLLHGPADRIKDWPEHDLFHDKNLL